MRRFNQPFGIRHGDTWQVTHGRRMHSGNGTVTHGRRLHGGNERLCHTATERVAGGWSVADLRCYRALT